jgi:hypothetical protein
MLFALSRREDGVAKPLLRWQIYASKICASQQEKVGVHHGV